VDDGKIVLWVAGELDVTVTAQMREAVSEACSAPGKCLTVDVSHLAFMDVGGLRVLTSAHDWLLNEGKSRLMVRGAQAIVRRLFEIMQVTSLLDDREPGPEAVRSGTLELARRVAGLSVTDLFAAYFALGGTAELCQVEAYLAGDSGALGVREREVAVHAVNERLIDLGRADQRISYPSDRGRVRPI
jgi:anti-anti-sigma factor